MRVVGIAVNVENTEEHHFIVGNVDSVPEAQETAIGYLAMLRACHPTIEWQITTIPHVLYGYTDPQDPLLVAQGAPPVTHLRLLPPDKTA